METKNIKKENKSEWFLLHVLDIQARKITAGKQDHFNTYYYDDALDAFIQNGYDIKALCLELGDKAETNHDYQWVRMEKLPLNNKQEALPMNIIEQDGIKPEPTKSQVASKLNTGSHGSDIESRITVLKSQTSSLIRKRDKMTEEIKDNQRRMRKLEKLLAEFKKI